MTVKAKKKKIKKQLRLKGISGKIKSTPQQILIARNLAEGKKKGEALIAAGVSPANARSNSAEIIAQPGVRAALATALDEAGVTTDRIAQVLDDGLSAMKIIEANLLSETVNGKPVITKQFVEVDDYMVRHTYLVTGCKLMDLFPADRTPGAPDLPPGEEASMIAQAEASAGQRDISRYMVIRERQTA